MFFPLPSLFFMFFGRQFLQICKGSFYKKCMALGSLVFVLGVIFGFFNARNSSYVVELDINYPSIFFILTTNLICIFKIYLGGLSIGIFSLWCLLTTAIPLGMVLNRPSIYNSITLFVFGLLPHGVFEILSYILAFSLGLELCSVLIVNPILGKSPYFSFKKHLLLLMFSLSLLILAAVVECYITPHISSWGWKVGYIH